MARRIVSLGWARLGWLASGLAALIVATAAGFDGRLIAVIAAPAPVVRAALVAVAVVAGVALLARAVSRLSAADEGTAGEHDLVSLTRGVRLAFLSIAAFAAAGGWAVGHPVPLVVALVIAGVDVLETSFLLLVIASRALAGPDDHSVAGR